MIDPPRREAKARLQILRLEIRQLFENLLAAHPRRIQIEDVADANPHPSNARPPAALLRIDRDSVGDCVHERNYKPHRDAREYYVS